MSDENKNDGGSVSSFLKGIVAGAAAAVVYLFARKKESRDKIQRWMHEARADILDKLSQMEQVSKEKYHAVVDEVVDTYRTSHDVTEDHLEEFRSNLKGRWSRIKKEAQGSFDDAKSQIKKAKEELRKEAEIDVDEGDEVDAVTSDDLYDSDDSEESI